jgi:hypothetical protein
MRAPKLSGVEYRNLTCRYYGTRIVNEALLALHDDDMPIFVNSKTLAAPR